MNEERRAPPRRAGSCRRLAVGAVLLAGSRVQMRSALRRLKRFDRRACAPGHMTAAACKGGDDCVAAGPIEVPCRRRWHVDRASPPRAAGCEA
eukprot:3990454-Prymnesium_polylepis.2